MLDVSVIESSSIDCDYSYVLKQTSPPSLARQSSAIRGSQILRIPQMKHHHIRIAVMVMVYHPALTTCYRLRQLSLDLARLLQSPVRKRQVFSGHPRHIRVQDVRESRGHERNALSLTLK